MRWAFALVVLAMTGCDDAVCPSGTTEQLGHCIRNSELADANVGTGGQQASTGSEGTAATAPSSGGAGDQAARGGSAAGSDPANSSGAAGTGAGQSASGSAGTAAGSSGGGAGSSGGGAPEPKCGNGVREGKELCDGADCISRCDTANACLIATLIGAPATCDAQCGAPIEVAECKSGDGCCAKGCKYPEDADCSKSCGDGVVDAPELCEPTSKDKPCPTSCDDQDPCTRDVRTGVPEQCNVVCSHMAITAPANGDGCCPRGANIGNDNDCDAVCGDGVVSTGETCEPNSKSNPCPSSCDDGNVCTEDALMGTATSCTAECRHAPIARSGPTSCEDNDPCTKDSKVNSTSSCTTECKHEQMSRSGPTSCNDGDSCTQDSVFESSSTCTRECRNTRITEAKGGDGCCPSGASSSNDSDCHTVCGNGVKEAGEECDPKATGEVVGYSCDTSCRRLNRLTPCTDELPGQCQGAPPSVCDSGFCRPTCSNLQLGALCEPLPGATKNESICTGAEPRACAWLCTVDEEDAYCGPSLWCDGTYCRVKP